VTFMRLLGKKYGFNCDPKCDKNKFYYIEDCTYDPMSFTF